MTFTKHSIYLVLTVFLFSFSGCSPSLQKHPVNIASVKNNQQTLIDSYTEIEFVLIPGGSFQMGSPESEEGRDQDEGPVHKVFIDSFYMSRYETTQAQWEKIMGNNPSLLIGPPNLPVDNVSWDQVQSFVRKLNEITGRTYRLPTEAEWEYACRAGTETPFASGKDEAILSDYAWYIGNSWNESHPVGTRKPNLWGLYDMHGNVNEWVQDGRRFYFSSEQHNPKGDEKSLKAVCRGGSWLYPARLCRSANRMVYDKNYSAHITGFRLAIDSGKVSKIQPLTP